LNWVSLDGGVARLDSNGAIVACTADVRGVLCDDSGAQLEPGLEVTTDEDSADPNSVMQNNLQRKTVPQILQLLHQIGIVPKSAEKRKDRLVALYLEEKRRKASASADTLASVKSFLSPVGTGREPPMHSDYAHLMGMVDRIDQAHSDAWPHHRVLGGSDRSFTLHLLTFLFLNARAAHADLTCDGVHRAPGAVRAYVELLLRNRTERRGK
jgi:hypothetical protein